MKNTAIASVLIALSVAASGSAFAQRDDRGPDRGDYQQHDKRDDKRDKHDDKHEDKHDNKHDRRDNDRKQAAHDHGNKYHKDDARGYRRDDSRGGGPRHDLRRGHKLDKEYRDKRYVVTDWRARHLSAPPKGHQWVRAGNDYVLAAIATGIIAQVLLSN